MIKTLTILAALCSSTIVSSMEKEYIDNDSDLLQDRKGLLFEALNNIGMDADEAYNILKTLSKEKKHKLKWNKPFLPAPTPSSAEPLPYVSNPYKSDNFYESESSSQIQNYIDHGKLNEAAELIVALHGGDPAAFNVKDKSTWGEIDDDQPVGPYTLGQVARDPYLASALQSAINAELSNLN